MLGKIDGRLAQVGMSSSLDVYGKDRGSIIVAGRARYGSGPRLGECV